MTRCTALSIALTAAGLFAAAFLVYACTPTSAPPVPAVIVPSVTVTASGGAVATVPPTLPGACREAFLVIGGPLLTAREALKGILRGEERLDHAAALELANIELVRGQSAVNAALLDCGSADIAVAQAYRGAVGIVPTADVVAALLPAGEIMPAPLAGLQDDLTLIELALAQN